ncbi:hypothetical protein T484DRAFT_3290091 [Baffinella frigidus]|nr:hypothetical protein T484DRAFT_3290091 [Cryptophyta sp. CCMP2293]
MTLRVMFFLFPSRGASRHVLARSAVEREAPRVESHINFNTSEHMPCERTCYLVVKSRTEGEVPQLSVSTQIVPQLSTPPSFRIASSPPLYRGSRQKLAKV